MSEPKREIELAQGLLSLRYYLENSNALDALDYPEVKEHVARAQAVLREHRICECCGTQYVKRENYELHVSDACGSPC